MDLVKLIKEKAKYFSDTEEDYGVSSVVSHIEIAERHYSGGQTGDEYLFNDVIYRCNQAFEGSLKEAYRIITQKESEGLTPYKIEKYLEENNVLKERVLNLFKNYRTEWRNKSTHDYKLYFSEQEAFLAIVNISAFINILLDQMIERRAYIKEAQEMSSGKIKKAKIQKDVGLLNSAIELLTNFSTLVPSKTHGTALPRITERELIGSLNAYLNESDSEIRTIPEYAILLGKNNRSYQADFLLETQNEKLLIEIKAYRGALKRVLSDGSDQLSAYMAASGIENGILFIPPIKENLKMNVINIERMVANKIYKITQIYPEK